MGRTEATGTGKDPWGARQLWAPDPPASRNPAPGSSPGEWAGSAPLAPGASSAAGARVKLPAAGTRRPTRRGARTQTPTLRGEGTGCSHSGAWGPGHLPGGACPRPHSYLHSPRAPRDSRAGTKSFMAGVLGRLRNEGSATCARSASLYPVLGDLTRFAPPCGPISAPASLLPSPEVCWFLEGKPGGRGKSGGGDRGSEKGARAGLGARGEDTQPTPTSQVPQRCLVGGCSFFPTCPQPFGSGSPWVLSPLRSQCLLESGIQSRGPRVNLCGSA